MNKKLTSLLLCGTFLFVLRKPINSNCLNILNPFALGYKIFQKYYRSNSKIKKYYEKKKNQILFKIEYDLWKFDGYSEVIEIYKTKKPKNGWIIPEKNPYIYLIDKNNNRYLEKGEVLIDNFKDNLNYNEFNIDIADFYLNYDYL